MGDFILIIVRCLKRQGIGALKYLQGRTIYLLRPDRSVKVPSSFYLDFI